MRGRRNWTSPPSRWREGPGFARFAEQERICFRLAGEALHLSVPLEFSPCCERDVAEMSDQCGAMAGLDVGRRLRDTAHRLNEFSSMCGASVCGVPRFARYAGVPDPRFHRVPQSI